MKLASLNMRRIQKKCIFLFLFFTISWILSYKFYKNILLDQTLENCHTGNLNLFLFETKCSHIVNAFFKKHSENGSLTNKTTHQKWLPMALKMYAYSAFYERCPTIVHQNYCIKFVGIALYNISSVSPFISTIPCALKSDHHIHRNITTIELLPESHNKTFTAAYFYCPIVSNITPSHASLYDNSSNLNWLIVDYPKSLNEDARKLTAPLSHLATRIPDELNLCVRPFYDDLDVLQLIEFLSFYTAMGIDHFIFYYTSSFKTLDLVISLRKFSNVSFEILYWDIPLVDSLIHEYGQIAFTQDCLSRSKYVFKHTIIVDVDEYIMPQIHTNIKELLHYLDLEHRMGGSYVIPMALFCSEYFNKNNYIYPFHSLNHRMRQKTSWLHHYRSKYIIRPDRVRYSGIHFTWEFEDGYHEVNIPPKIALINHYRTCCGMAQTWFLHLLEFKVLHDKVVTDNSMLNHLNELLNHPLSKIVSNITASISYAAEPG